MSSGLLYKVNNEKHEKVPIGGIIKPMQDSIFTKIIKGDIPCHKVYEDERTIAFLDIHPLTTGHVLVVPKEQVDHFDDLETEDYQAVWAAVRRIARRQKEVFGSNRVCIRVEGFDVPHAHVHVYPCNSPKDFYGNADRLQQEPNHSELAEIAIRLAITDKTEET
jgi:histidine triad (HIT) family protein